RPHDRFRLHRSDLAVQRRAQACFRHSGGGPRGSLGAGVSGRAFPARHGGCSSGRRRGLWRRRPDVAIGWQPAHELGRAAVSHVPGAAHCRWLGGTRDPARRSGVERDHVRRRHGGRPVGAVFRLDGRRARYAGRCLGLRTRAAS
ncbi:hypothetical protein KXW39_000347, partial [Aspergillus fumigatus]